jgi:predicted permease
MPESRHNRVYRRFLSLYPAWFRQLYSADMEADFDELLTTSRRTLRRRGVIRAWAIVGWDLFVTLPREWLATLRGSTTPSSTTIQRHRGEIVRSLITDLRSAVRVTLRRPAFASLVVLTLGVGIGINVAMFSVVDAVLLSPLSYADADQLAMVWNRYTNTETDRVLISGPDLLDYRERATMLEDVVFIHNAADHTLNDGQRAEQVEVTYVSSNMFDVLGVTAAIGRTFRSGEENTADAMSGPAILSHALWTSRYGADPDVLGRTIQLGGRPTIIVGVLPADFDLVLPYREGGSMSSNANEKADVWKIMPERGFPTFPRSLALFRIVARVRDGVTFAQAQAELDGVATQLRREHRTHEERGTEIDLVPLRANVVESVRPTILTLFGAVAVILVLACANVANLVSVRAAHRRREMAVRAALGANAGQLVRQLFTESALLAVGGGILGVVLAAVLIDGIVALAPANVPLLDRVAIDGRALAFAVIAGSFATMLFGIQPALRTSSRAARVHLASAGRPGVGRGHRFRSLIVTGEIALTLVLLIGGGLLVRSFLHLQAAQLGFAADRVLTARIAIGHGAYDDDALRAQYWESLRRGAANLLQVRHAGLVTPLPFGGQGAEIPYGSTVDEAQSGQFVSIVASTTPGYFDAMGAVVLDGRTFEESDQNRTDIAVIDDIAAERIFPGARAVGRSMWLPDMEGTGIPDAEQQRSVEIVGVVRHIRHSNVTGEEREVIYRPVTAPWTMALVTQTTVDPATVIPALERMAGELDPDIPMFDVRPITGYIADRNATTRFTMTLATIFGLVALLLSAVGLYGVIAYAVEQRTSEMGLRMAFGATPGRIVRLILTQGGTLAGIGLVIGLGTALAVGRIIEGLLVGVRPHDPVTFIIVPATLMVAALLAAWIPARRASRLDPLDTLRTE